MFSSDGMGQARRMEGQGVRNPRMTKVHELHNGWRDWKWAAGFENTWGTGTRRTKRMPRGGGREGDGEEYRGVCGQYVCISTCEILQEVLEQTLGCLSFDCELYEGGNWHEPFSHRVAGRPWGPGKLEGIHDMIMGWHGGIWISQLLRWLSECCSALMVTTSDSSLLPSTQHRA